MLEAVEKQKNWHTFERRRGGIDQTNTDWAATI